MKKFLVLIFLAIISSCKDDCPDPGENCGNNGTGGNGNSSEYTIKGKLLNGTTMQPINPGMVMTLVVQNIGLQVREEELGTCTIQEDGSFELTYPHSQLAEIITATMRFESQFYISDYLPKNQDLDTILYKSSWAKGVIQTIN
jgi:hypothetical protein